MHIIFSLFCSELRSCNTFLQRSMNSGSSPRNFLKYTVILLSKASKDEKLLFQASTNKFINPPELHTSFSSYAFQLSEIMNSGKLVPDEIIFNLLSKRLEAGESKGESGFILDGFPRTIRQAEILNKVTEIDLVVNLKMREDVLVQKCLGRRTCSQCGKGFNVASINAKAENGRPAMSMAPLLQPPNCTVKLSTRADDTEEIINERLRVYKESSQPVEDFYRNEGKLMEFDLPGGIPESWPKLLEALNLEEQKVKRSAVA